MYLILRSMKKVEGCKSQLLGALRRLAYLIDQREEKDMKMRKQANYIEKLEYFITRKMDTKTLLKGFIPKNKKKGKDQEWLEK